MLKYYTYELTFAEVPDEISLCFSISNCQNRCDGCHSPFLREDVGDTLDKDSLCEIVNRHREQFTCICFLGEGNDKNTLQELITFSKKLGYRTCLYSGRDDVCIDEYKDLNYIKIGSYKTSYGPLNKKTTNQKMYKLSADSSAASEDITYKFWGGVTT